MISIGEDNIFINMAQDKGDFIRVYANIPIPIRHEIIYINDKGKPISWDVAYLEIENNTELGRKILERLSRMKII